MDDEQDHNDEKKPHKIRVVDKRISSRAPASPPSEPRSEKAPAEPSPADPDRHEAPPPPVEAAEEATVTPLRPPVDEASAAASHPAGGAAPAAVTPPPPPGAAGEGVWTPEQQEEAARMAEEMARIPSLEWVINVSVTLANAAGTKLNAGQVDDAGLAIDALAALVEKVGPNLGDAEAPLRQTLAQLQMGYAQMAGGPTQPES